MYGLHQIASDLKTLLGASYRSVRISTAQVNEQLLTEIRAINREKLPAVIIVTEQSDFALENSVRETRITLVLVDRFVADAEERACNILAESETLLALFLPGRTINQVYFQPVQSYAASADPGYVCFALVLNAKQGV